MDRGELKIAYKGVIDNKLNVDIELTLKRYGYNKTSSRRFKLNPREKLTVLNFKKEKKNDT